MITTGRAAVVSWIKNGSDVRSVMWINRTQTILKILEASSYLILKSEWLRRYGQHVRKLWSLPSEWINNKIKKKYDVIRTSRWHSKCCHCCVPPDILACLERWLLVESLEVAKNHRHLSNHCCYLAFFWFQLKFWHRFHRNSIVQDDKTGKIDDIGDDNTDHGDEKLCLRVQEHRLVRDLWISMQNHQNQS